MKRKVMAILLSLALCLSLSTPALAQETSKAGQANVVSAGAGTMALIDAEGGLWTWGANYNGELGNGDKSMLKNGVPAKIMDDVASVSVGRGNHVAAIKTDGSLWMWGKNQFGQVSCTENGEQEIYTPMKVMDGVTAVSCGGGHTAVIKTDGSLWTWGWNTAGQLGNGTQKTQATPVKVMDGVTSVSCGHDTTAAIKADGSLWMWGGNFYNELANDVKNEWEVPVKVMDNAAAVACNWNYTGAIKTDGSLWMWGRNGDGRLGDGTKDGRPAPVKIMDNVKSLSLGDHGTAAAVKTDGTLWCWGSEPIGNGTRSDSLTPVRVLDHVAAVSIGYSGRAAVKTDGTLWLWGLNGDGEMGVGSDQTPIETPFQHPTLTTKAQGGSSKPEQPTSAFSDVKSTDYFAEPVQWAVDNNITSGTSGTTFSPNNSCTRAQAVTFLWRAAGSPKVSGSNPFSDVSSSTYYYEAVLWAVQNGITSGTSSNTFSPNSVCQRSQIVVFLYRYAGSPTVSGGSSFSDVSSSAYYSDAVQWAVKNEVTSGTGGGRFSPSNTCTRAQIVTFLYRYIAE